jgi:hypothetical protein
VSPVNLADLDLRSAGTQVTWHGRNFRIRNRNYARVEYVLGEVYWKCQVGETTSVADYTAGRDVLSREGSKSEVRWSFSTPVPKPVLEKAFGIKLQQVRLASSGGGGSSPTAIALIVLAFIVLACVASYFDDGSGGGGGGVVVGGGVFSGGK